MNRAYDCPGCQRVFPVHAVAARALPPRRTQRPWERSYTISSTCSATTIPVNPPLPHRRCASTPTRAPSRSLARKMATRNLEVHHRGTDGQLRPGCRRRGRRAQRERHLRRDRGLHLRARDIDRLRSRTAPSFVPPLRRRHPIPVNPASPATFKRNVQPGAKPRRGC